MTGQNQSEPKNEVEIETSGLLTCPHGFSTRIGGVSEGIWESLNLGMNRGDQADCVTENWRRFLCRCGIFEDRIVWGKQVHGTAVPVVTRADAHSIADHEPQWEADGYVTKDTGVPLVVFTADCVPVLLEDNVHGVIGAVHSGWRGTVKDIVGVAVEKMLTLGAQLTDIRVAIGPAIDDCCFEVGSEVVTAVTALLGSEAELFYRKRGEKYLLNLRGGIERRLLQIGISSEHINKVGDCTMCHPSRYFSHRYTKGERGSLAAVIMQKG